MRETLYIRLGVLSPDAPTAYLIAAPEIPGSAAAAVPAREASLADTIAMAAGRKLVVFVPGAEVRLTQVKVPAKQPAKVLQAAPYMLEDQFAEDVDTLHFALGPRQPDGAFPVAVASREHMEEWLTPFRAAGRLPDALVPETLALPWDGGPWSVLPEARHITVRTGPYSGFSCVPEDFELFLHLAEAGTEQSLRVLVPRFSQEDYTRMQRPLELLPGFDQPLEALVRFLKLPQTINLLQGQYSQRESLERFWLPWRFAAGLLAVTFLLGVIDNGVEALRLGHAAKLQETANESRYNEIFPGTRASSLPLATQIEQQEQILRGGNAQGALFTLLQRASTGLSATPGLTLKTLEFRDGALFMDLSGTDLQVLEKLRAWFGGHRDVNLEVQSADSGESGVQIRLKLSMAKATT